MPRTSVTASSAAASPRPRASWRWTTFWR